MAWDYAESNPFAESSGSLNIMIRAVSEAVSRVPARSTAHVLQTDAASHDCRGAVISTDPPYYDNIGYSDLSDFFYVWLRRSLKDVHPSLFSTMLVPKAEELVANQYRHGGKDGARDFFEDGFRTVFASPARSCAPTACSPSPPSRSFQQARRIIRFGMGTRPGRYDPFPVMAVRHGFWPRYVLQRLGHMPCCR